MRQAADMRPDDPALRVSAIWYLNYQAGQTTATIAEQYRQWARKFLPRSIVQTVHRRQRDPQRRLRVGYISPDYCRHSVAYYFEPILDGHDRDRFEIFGYGHVPDPDDTTARFEQKFDRYQSVWGLSAGQVAERLRADELDILVALAGHCTNNCLPALAYKPAPIQVDLGGITTTGMTQIDYRLTDAVVDPPEEQTHFTETLSYLPGGWSVFRPPLESPLVGPSPAQANGYVTFGSFNNNVKIDASLLRAWARILQACPDARFLFKSFSMGDTGIRKAYRDHFIQHGIDPERIEFRGQMSYHQHLETLGQVDIALDAYPFNGGMTTLEGLWMGVPIVTLSGRTCVARVGRGILRRVGLEVFAADTLDEYVAKAVAFAGQAEALGDIRRGLRECMLQSPLCDPGRMAREIEAAYRGMWRDWIDDC
jgi:predicted O-linked N-acetylglucosamine transferase (SPINDLY family)